jgi:hypothetical protein
MRGIVTATHMKMIEDREEVCHAAGGELEQAVNDRIGIEPVL